MTKKQNHIGIIITGCDGNRLTKEEVEQIASRLEYAGTVKRDDVVYVPEASSADITPITDTISKKEYKRVVLCG